MSDQQPLKRKMSTSPTSSESSDKQSKRRQTSPDATATTEGGNRVNRLLEEVTKIWAAIKVPENVTPPDMSMSRTTFTILPRRPSRNKDKKKRPHSKPHTRAPITGPGSLRPGPEAIRSALESHNITPESPCFICMKCAVTRPARLIAQESWLHQETCAYCMDPRDACAGEDGQVRWCWAGRHETRRGAHQVRMPDGVRVEMPHCHMCMREGREACAGRTVEERAEELWRAGEKAWEAWLQEVALEEMRTLVGPLEKGDELEGWEGWAVVEKSDGDWIVEGDGGRGVRQRLTRPKEKRGKKGGKHERGSHAGRG